MRGIKCHKKIEKTRGKRLSKTTVDLILIFDTGKYRLTGLAGQGQSNTDNKDR